MHGSAELPQLMPDSRVFAGAVSDHPLVRGHTRDSSGSCICTCLDG